MILNDEKMFLNDIQEVMNEVRTFWAGMCISDELKTRILAKHTMNSVVPCQTYLCYRWLYSSTSSATVKIIVGVIMTKI
jgi:hypothetical protein